MALPAGGTARFPSIPEAVPYSQQDSNGGRIMTYTRGRATLPMRPTHRSPTMRFRAPTRAHADPGPGVWGKVQERVRMHTPSARPAPAVGTTEQAWRRMTRGREGEIGAGNERPRSSSEDTKRAVRAVIWPGMQHTHGARCAGRRCCVVSRCAVAVSQSVGVWSRDMFLRYYSS